MTKTTYLTLWGGLFILCAALGFIPEPTGILRFLLVALSIVFFVPPAIVLYQAARSGDRHTIRLIRNLSAISLLLTLASLIVNFMSLMASDALGNFLYAVLVIVSTPMISSQYWLLSLFLWACLLMVSLSQLKKR